MKNTIFIDIDTERERQVLIGKGHDTTPPTSPEEAKEIPAILDYYKYDLKAISFLPKTEAGAYKQMPYEAITEEEYNKRNSSIKPFNVGTVNQDSKPELFCDSDKCTVL